MRRMSSSTAGFSVSFANPPQLQSQRPHRCACSILLFNCTAYRCHSATCALCMMRIFGEATMIEHNKEASGADYVCMGLDSVLD